MEPLRTRKKSKTKWWTYALLSLVVIVIPLIGFQSGNPVINTYGRLHPVLVHFPIAFIFLIIAMEWFLSRSNNQLVFSIMSLIYLVTLLSCLLAVLAGAILSSSGEYGSRLLRIHTWGSIATVILLIWTIYFRERYLFSFRKAPKRIYHTLLIAMGVLVFYTGHQGGSLTHGSGYLTEPLRKAAANRSLEAELKSPEEMLVYADIIHPILETKCISCHNKNKTKGGLDLSTYEAFMAAVAGPYAAVQPYNPDASEIIRRVMLDSNHDDFMPPDGKKPMDQEEIKLFHWWIANGAVKEDTFGQGPDIEGMDFSGIINRLAEQQAMARLERRQRTLVWPKLLKRSFDLGVVIQKDDSNDSSYYVLSMQVPPKFVDDRTLQELMPYKDAFSKVSLPGSEITDDGLYYIGQMSNLKELIVSKTCLTGEGLSYLNELDELQLLNLSHTRLSNSHVLSISRLPALKKVYMFNTLVDPVIIEALNQDLKDVQITQEEGPYY